MGPSAIEKCSPLLESDREEMNSHPSNAHDGKHLTTLRWLSSNPHASSAKWASPKDWRVRATSQTNTAFPACSSLLLVCKRVLSPVIGPRDPPQTQLLR